MEEINLDRRDRGNLYKENTTNVFAHEMSLEEARGDFNSEDIEYILDEAQAKVHLGREDVVYVVIKITK